MNRFAFGENWSRFLRTLDDDRIERAKRSLQDMLGVDTLAEKTFLDAGSGSGLFSLAARQLGARVHSFDFDPESVICTDWLRRSYCPNDERVDGRERLGPRSRITCSGLASSTSSIAGAFCTTRARCGRHCTTLFRWSPPEDDSLSRSTTIRDERAGHG